MASAPGRVTSGSRAAGAGARREEIVGAAAQLFARHGFHGTSIDDIGAAVGITGPGLYRHFPGKESVLAEMLLGISRRLLDEADRIALTTPDPASALDALLSWHIDFALSQPALITVHDRELDNVPDPARLQVRRLQRRYAEEWVKVLSRIFPGQTHARLRAATHAAFGLLNSTPHSASQLSRAEMASLLHAMARAALLGPITSRDRA
jgi:AcrR family transcriptional regulator